MWLTAVGRKSAILRAGVTVTTLSRNFFPRPGFDALEAFMKKAIAAILTTALLALAPVYGQGALKERQENQKDRIKAGVNDGSLNKAEAARMKQDQREIKQDIRQAHADGVVTGKEAAQITREQNKASRRIAKQKHDKQNQK
jgi:hypothetical protein